MQQHSGFEDRSVDTYCPFDTDGYAPVFKSDGVSLTVFPGVKSDFLSSNPVEKTSLSSASVILPVALIFAAVLLVFLKNVIKSSIGSLFLVGLSPKSLQEAERRQIERNSLIINSINIVSFFSLAIIFYAIYVRFEFLFNTFEMAFVPKYFRYLTIFLFITGIVFLLFYIRSRFITFFGNVFSASKILRGYLKPYKLLFVSLSPVLFLIALFTAFAPFAVMSIVSFYLLICISAFYAVFVVVSLAKFFNFTNRYTIHIFLYLCTLEILPFLILVKLTQNVCF